MAGLNAGTPAATVFVGNLSYDLTDQGFTDYFSQVGPVKTVRIVTERESGKPRGFGFVEFYDVATAESAVRNLSGKDFNGRAIRVVFAEGGPNEGFRPRHEEERGGFGDRGPRGGGGGGGGREPPRDRVVGGDLSYHASRGVATMLGQPAVAGAPADHLTMMLARKTRSELYDYMAQMQALLAQNPGQARQILVQNPVLAKALFQMQVILGMVGNPLGDVAPKGVAPPGTMPGRHFAASEPGPMQPPQMQEPPPQQQQQPVPMQQMHAPPAYGGPQHGGPPPYQQHPPGMLPPEPHPGYMQPPPMQQPPYMPQPEPVHLAPPPHLAAPQPVPMDPRLAAANGTGPVDPRRAAGPGAGPPRPMISVTHAPPGQPQMPPAAVHMQPPPVAAPVAPMGAGMTPEQQQALLQQVMSLTPQQVELLPPQQKAQVLALQQQMRGGR